MRRILLAILFLQIILEVKGQIRIIEDVYTTFDKRSIPVYLIEGRYTVVSFDKTRITATQLRDSSTLKIVVDRIDSLYGFYKTFFGREPVGGWAAYSYKCPVSFVPPSCGAACGLVGGKGIEVGPDMLTLIFNEHKYDTKTYRIGIVGYEFGRNFFTFGSKVLFPYDLALNQTNGGFAEGFASFVGLLAFLDDCKRRPSNYIEFQETYLNYDWLLNSFRSYYNDPASSPDSNLHKNKFIFDINRSYYGNYYGVYSGPILVGTHDLLKNEIRWPDFFQALYTAPNATTKEIAMGNIALSFSSATRYDLNAYFKNVLKFRYSSQVETAIAAFPKSKNRLIRDKDVLYFTGIYDTIQLNVRSINHLSSNSIEYVVKADGLLLSRNQTGQNILTYRQLFSRDSSRIGIYLYESGSLIDSQFITLKKRDNFQLTKAKDQFFFAGGNGTSIPKYVDSTYIVESVSNVENFPLFELIYPLTRNQRYVISAKISTKASRSPGNIDSNGDGIIDYWARMSIGGGAGLDGTARVGYDIGVNDTAYYDVSANINTNSYFTQPWALSLPYVLQKVYLEATGVGVFRFKSGSVKNVTDTDGDGVIDFQDKCPLRVNPAAPRTFDTIIYLKDRASYKPTSNLANYRFVWYSSNLSNAVGDTAAPNFALLGPGTYRYYVSYRSLNDLCETDRSLFTIQIVSPRLFIYPSPNNGIFKVGFQTQLSTQYQIQITDSKGSVVMRNQYTGMGGYQVFDIQLSTLSRGVYHLQARSFDGSYVDAEKFLVH